MPTTLGGYDLLDRLTSAGKTGLSQGWTYDANGNRLSQTGTSSSTHSISGTSNRLTGVSGSLSRTYTYDAAGNATDDGAATLVYDSAGRMTSATKSGTTTTYALNALGQRVRKTTSGVSTIFVYDESGLLLGEYTASGDLIREYVWLRDIPIAVITAGPGTPPYVYWYIHTDHLNAPRAVENSTTGQLVWRWDSAPFGETAPDPDPDGDTLLFTLPLRFPGQYADVETGLNYNYFRDYESMTGRYIESDPIGLAGGINTFEYALSNPVLNTDPEGLQTPALCANPANAAACVAAGEAIPAARAASGAAAARAARRLLWPEKRGGKWICHARADCDDNIPGNCPEDPLKKFAFGIGVATNLGDARNTAKRNATHLLACQPKHVSCKCTGPKGEQYNGGC